MFEHGSHIRCYGRAPPPPSWPGTATLPVMTRRDWIREQQADEAIGWVINYKTQDSKPAAAQKNAGDTETSAMLREWNRLQLRDKILYRVRQIQGQTHYQLVVPKKYRSEALIGLHDHVGHPGVDRTLELVRSRYYWPGMSRDVDNKVHHCERCTRRKDPPPPGS